MKISIQSFKGIAPKLNPRYLGDGMAQIAQDVEAAGQSLKPLSGLGSSLLTLPKTGPLYSIYRFGQDISGDTQYWFHWPYPVDVCRSQIAGDAAEWTFFTDYHPTLNPSGYPKATYNTLALTGETGQYPIGARCLGLPPPDSPLQGTVTQPTAEKSAASLTLTSSIIAAMTVSYGLKIAVTVNGSTTTYNCTLPKDGSAGLTPGEVKTAIDNEATAHVWTVVDGTGLKITTDDLGSDVTLVVTWGNATGQSMTAKGATKDAGALETRVYTYTWIASEAGLVMESAPEASANTLTVNAYPGSTVTLSGFGTAPTSRGYNATGLRIYRATAGTYLFVDELTLTQLSANGNEYEDSKSASELGEPLPSTTWNRPPDTLRGLINLPNGMMAGFSGRDVYLCVPYRPYAWPDEYRQTVDYPIVGFGRLDTTLVVLTEGTPYLIQGASPEYATVVKSDLEQACASKQSIVSFGGAVLYASPDGLVQLAPGGSKLVTEALFDRADWQGLNPASIHAYGHDNQYVAFYTTVGGTKGGFVYDLRTGQLVMNTLGAGTEVDVLGGYADLRKDQLFLVTSENKLVKWDAGGARTGKWRSKLFSMPQITGFSCAQVEAAAFVDAGGNAVSAYPNGQACRVYCDGTLVHTQALTSRTPFRLPPVQGRDWEIELDVKSEIFNVVIAQSMSEIAEA